MDEEEIEKLIANLRMMMTEAGFGWAVEQAEVCLSDDVQPRERAKALIDAAEGVTVDLAEAEIRTLDSLGVGEIQFKADDGDAYDDEIGISARSMPFEVSDGLRGRRRRTVMEDLVNRRSAFVNLRDALDGIQ